MVHGLMMPLQVESGMGAVARSTQANSQSRVVYSSNMRQHIAVKSSDIDKQRHMPLSVLGQVDPLNRQQLDGAVGNNL